MSPDTTKTQNTQRESRSQERIPLIFRLFVHNPELMLKNLALLKEKGHIQEIPTLWQVIQGMAQQWSFTAANLEKLGHDQSHPVRDSAGARLLQPQLLRFIPLLIEGAINPWDRSGLALTPERKMRHILGTHHGGETVMYDMQLLDCYPGALESLRDQLNEILENDTPRSRWLRDLVVYEGYHEALKRVVDRALAGDFTVPEEAPPGDDYTVGSFVDRCLACPVTPEETLRRLIAA